MEREDAGLTLWDLRSDTDDLQSAEWECDDLACLVAGSMMGSASHASGTAAVQAGPPAPMALMAGPGAGSRDEQISTVTVKREHSHNTVNIPQEHQSAWSTSVEKFKAYYESLVDERQIDNDGWFVEEPGQDKYNEDYGKSMKSRQAGPACTSTSTTRKRPFSDMNSGGIRKIINLADIRNRSKGCVSDDGQWLNYQINKKRKHEIVATTSSKEPRFHDSNTTSGPRFSCKTNSKSIGQIGSMSLPAHQQELEKEGSHCRNKNRNIQKSSDVHDQLPDVVPSQSQQKLKDILEQAVSMADKATLAKSGLSSAPSGYVLKSYMYSQAKKMVANQESGDHGDKKSTNSAGKQKPRPSERARILRRLHPKPTPPSDRTFLALIPVVPPPTNPITETSGSSVEEKGKTNDVKMDENKMVTRSQVKKLQPKPSQAELGETIAESNPVPNPLYSTGTVFRRIAPKPQGPKLPESQVPAPMFVPIFELVPVKSTTSTTEKPNAGKLPLLRPKTSSGRRKQDPLSVQTRGEKWRQEESEMLVEESREADEVKEDQNVVNLISDEEEEGVEEVEEEEGWEVLEVEVKTEDEADCADISW